MMSGLTQGGDSIRHKLVTIARLDLVRSSAIADASRLKIGAEGTGLSKTTGVIQ